MAIPERTRSRVKMLLWLLIVYIACGLAGVRLEAQARAAEAGSPAQRKVVVISVDGLPWPTLRDAEQLGIKIPNLLEMHNGGAVAAGMVGVFPSITFPSHTAMMTGQSPAVNGVWANTLFDPEGRMNGARYWYAELIRVPALWDVARAAGLRTAAVSWPVTIGAAIDFNFPEHRLSWSVEDVMLQRVIATPGLMAQFEKEHGRLQAGTPDDVLRTRQAAFLLRTKRPDLLLVHLIDVDHVEHAYGPDSPQALQTLEKTDEYIGLLRRDARTAGLDGSTVWVIVSDHGFLPHRRSLDPAAVLASVGLGAKPEQGGWRVAVHNTSASFALITKDPDDREAQDLALHTFLRLKEEGRWGIDRVFDRAALKEMKTFPEAFMAVSMAPGYAVGKNSGGAWLTEQARPGGAHGHAPGPEGLESVFVAFGPSIARASLPRGRLQDVAPTVAGILGVRMPAGIQGRDLLAKAPEPRPAAR